MKDKELIKRLEDEIENIEGMRYHCKVRFDDVIERLKKFRFDLKYPNINLPTSKNPSTEILKNDENRI